ncbi:DUF6265 family protein [Flavobacterium rhizosphaerae]|uniref:DUF6265 family protein n=1 Tax=Flavobacterium rhizosphaerae TaxID=3163298 RepID=A0ABW8Z2T9_9FLAO
MKKQTFTLLICLLVLCGCTNNAHPDMEKAAWLLGTWGDEADGNVSTETWRKVNDSVFHGKSYTLQGSDTVFSETMVIDDVNNEMTLTVTVPNQNNAEAIQFKMTSIDNDKIIFENPQHNFPSKITYNKISNDSLFAVISGTQGGNRIEVEFPMKKK